MRQWERRHGNGSIPQLLVFIGSRAWERARWLQQLDGHCPAACVCVPDDQDIHALSWAWCAGEQFEGRVRMVGSGGLPRAQSVAADLVRAGAQRVWLSPGGYLFRPA